jgi:HEPN domain-containing protein
MPARDAPVTPEAVDTFAEALARHMKPVYIVLFGSYAEGAPDARSDLDLLVVVETDRPPRERKAPFHDTIREAPCPTDVIMRTPTEVRRWLGTPNHIVTEAFEKGTVLYEAPDAKPFRPTSNRHREWAGEFVEKAESDLLTVRRVLEMEDGPTDTPAFHAQQAAEKALKAMLTVHEIDAPYTHELPELVDALPDAGPSLELWRADLKYRSTAWPCATRWECRTRHARRCAAPSRRPRRCCAAPAPRSGRATTKQTTNPMAPNPTADSAAGAPRAPAW